MHGWGANVWDAAGIECWAAAHRPDRPAASARFGRDAGAFLLAAERQARSAGVGWVDTSAFWAAVAAGDAGTDLRAAAGSMGITLEEATGRMASLRGPADRPPRSCRMTPRLQEFLAASDRAVAQSRRRRVRPLDILLAFIDAKPIRDSRWVPQPSDHLLAALGRRGLDIPELRRRLVAATADPASISAMDIRVLRPMRHRKRKRPDWLVLAPNPLGHDPWTRHPWGAAFARTRDGRHLQVDGEHWFFTTDADGFYVRAADGRPIGYRYRVLTKAPKRDPRPVNGFMEILPMPPVEMDHWPDGRFTRDD